MSVLHTGLLTRVPYEFEGLTQSTKDQMDQLVQNSQHPNWKPPFPFDGSCACVNTIRDHAGTSLSLETLYGLPTAEKRCHPLLDIRNIRAVRNRLILVENLFEQELKKIQNPRILEVASGSAQAVIEVIAKISHQGLEAQALLFDHDASALERAELLADQWGVKNRIQTVEGDILHLSSTAEKFQPNIIEMVGLADYLTESILTGLLRRFHRWLPPKGILIVGNVVVGNPEQPFIERIYKWPRMVYREIGKFRELFLKAGFSECTVETEPQGMHTIAVAHK